MALICTFKLLILQGIFKIQVLLKSKNEKPEGGGRKKKKKVKVQNMLRPEWNAWGMEAGHSVTEAAG